MFLCVGLFISILDLFLVWFLSKVMLLDVTLSVSLSYLVVVISRFILDNKYTFSESEAHIIRKFIGYLTVVFLNYLITLVIVNIVIVYIINQILIAKSFAILVTFFIGFFAMRFFVFTTKSSSCFARKGGD